MAIGWAVLCLVTALAAAAVLYLGYFVLRTRGIAAMAERLVPPAGRFMVLGDHGIHYVDEGEGPPIIFIHGLGAQLHQFKSTLFPGLSRDFRVIALDRPGSGYSTLPASATNRVTEQARIVAEFIEALKLDRPLVVAHSLGGAVALALALDHPKKISGVALIAPLTRHRPTVPPALAGLYIKSRAKRRLLANTFAVPTALKFADATLDYVFGPQKPDSDYMISGGGWLGLRPCAIVGASTDVVALEQDMPDLEKRIGEIALPVGVLFGTADRVLDFESDGMSIAARLPSVDFQPVRGYGHMLQFVATAETLAFVRRMAARVFGEARRPADGADGGDRTRTGKPEGF